jgi:hypothetical protein
MPTRAALRVINRHLNNTATPQEFDADGQDAIVAAYQVLADAMGASLEVTLDGQVVLYTGHFTPDIHGVEAPKTPQPFNLYAPAGPVRDLSTPEARAAAQREDEQLAEGFRGRIVNAREPTVEDLESEDYPPAVQLQWKKDAEVEAHYSNLDNQ